MATKVKTNTPETTGLPRVSVECKALHAALQRAGGALMKSSLPILSQVHLRAEDDRITIFAWGDSGSIVTILPAEVLTPGAFTLPYQQSVRLLATLSGSVEIQVEEKERVRLTCGKSRQNLLTCKPEEYPTAPEMEQQSISFFISSELLADALSSVLFAVSTEGKRSILCGVCLHFTGEDLRFVATDTHRLTVRTLKEAIPVETAGFQCILHSKGISDLLPLLKGAGAACVQISDKRAVFTLSDEGQTVIMLRLIEGRYPNYERIIPSEFTCDIILPVADTISALKRVELCADSSKVSAWRLTGNTLTIRGDSVTEGESEEEIKVGVLGGGMDFPYGLNVRYAIDALQAIPTETAVLRAPINQLKFCLLQPEGSEPDRMTVLVPMDLTMTGRG